MDEFDSPASNVKITEFEGNLILLTPTGFVQDAPTNFGPADYVETRVSVLDGDRQGETHEGVRIFQKALIGQCRPKVGTGRMILGRLGRGTAKPGQSAPWVLADPVEADKFVARDFLAQEAAKAVKKDEPPF